MTKKWRLPKFCAFLSFLLILSFVLSSKANAWGGDIHTLTCPEMIVGVQSGCSNADSREYQQNHPFLTVMNHLCLDNKLDCPPKIVAKYYVKKYFLEGKKDLSLLAAASHLIQDSHVPDHWFPMREYGRKIFVPFAPSWLGTTEGLVSEAVSRKTPNWAIERQYRGVKVVINQAYLDHIKKEATETVSAEPKESLADLATLVKKRSFWQNVRSYKELLLLAALAMAPVLAYLTFKALREKKLSNDLLIAAVVETAFLLSVAAICLFY